MKSAYLDSFFKNVNAFHQIWVYGAGGVAADFLTLADDHIDKKRTIVVVSQKTEKKEFKGFSLRTLEDAVSNASDCFVIIAVMGDAEKSIEDNLRRYKLENYCTVDAVIEKLYEEIWTSSIRDDKIFFSHADGKQYGDNPKYILEKLIGDSRGLDPVWVVESEGAYELPVGVREVRFGTYDYYWELGTSKVWVDDQHKNFFSRKREGQAYFQTWHGGGPLKKIEFDAEDTLSQAYLLLCERNSAMIDKMISPSRFNTELYRRAFHYDGEIMECGYPRNDIFFRGKQDAYRQKIKSFYGIPDEKDILLYAPTYRDGGFAKNRVHFENVMHAYRKKYHRDLTVLVRLHPIDMRESDQYFAWDENVINASKYDDVQELLAGADWMLTDYSSIMWDFGIMQKPVFLYHPDLEAYDRERGYYLSFTQMPYIECFDDRDLYDKIMQFDMEKYRMEIQDFYQKYGCFDRGNASKMIADEILRLVNQEFCC